MALKGLICGILYTILSRPSGSVAWTRPKEVYRGCASGTLKSGWKKREGGEKN